MARHQKRLLHKAVRGIASLVVCAVVLIPLATVVQLPKNLIRADSRKVIQLPAFANRKVDETHVPVKPFQEPLISVTFDDGWESAYTTATPLLQQYGIHTTQYIISGTLKDYNYMSVAQIHQLQDNGHEIACHTVNHPDLTTLSNAAVTYQMTGCLKTLQKSFGPIKDFASPYGSADTRTIGIIRKYFGSQRNTNGDISNGVDDNDVNIDTNFNRYDIIGVTMRRDTTVAQLQQAVNYTVAHNGWLVITYHEVGDNSSVFGLDAQVLKQQLAYLSRAPVRIVTMNQVVHNLPDSFRK